MALDLAALVLSCAPWVAPDTALALIQVESAGNPYAIGVVGGALIRQPTHLAEAVATVDALEAAGWNYSVGLGQINKRNFRRYGLTAERAFQPCANLAAMQGILGECYARASRSAAQPADQQALRNALSCYYSGNFITGHRHGYVSRVVAAWRSRTALMAVASGLGQNAQTQMEAQVAASASIQPSRASTASPLPSPRLAAAELTTTPAGALP